MLNQISSWIISIAGIICLSVIIELIMPDGQMNRYIKGILSFVIVLVIILPLPKLLKLNINIDNMFEQGSNIEVDEDYLYQLNLNKINAVKDTIEKEILEHGYKNVSIFINADIFNSQMQFKSVFVDLTKLVISPNAEHNDILKIKKDITSIVQKYVKIDEEAILYDG